MHPVLNSSVFCCVLEISTTWKSSAEHGGACKGLLRPTLRVSDLVVLLPGTETVGRLTQRLSCRLERRRTPAPSSALGVVPRLFLRQGRLSAFWPRPANPPLRASANVPRRTAIA